MSCTNCKNYRVHTSRCLLWNCEIESFCLCESYDPMPYNLDEIKNESDDKFVLYPNNPPLGLIPKWVYEIDSLHRRMVEVKEAIKRYEDANYAVPDIWREELEELILKRDEMRKEVLDEDV